MFIIFPSQKSTTVFTPTFLPKPCVLCSCSLPETRGLQRVYCGLATTDQVPVLSISPEQHATGGAVLRPALLTPNGLWSVRRVDDMCRTFSGSTHLWHDEQPPHQADAQDCG